MPISLLDNAGVGPLPGKMRPDDLNVQDVSPLIGNLEMWLKGLQWLVTFALIGWAVELLRRQSLRAAGKHGAGQAMKASPWVYAFAYGSILFWVALIVLSTLFSRSDAEQALAQGVFGFFLLMSVVLAYSCHSWVIQWEEAGITGPNWYGKSLRFSWTQMVALEYSPGLQTFLLKSDDGRTLWIPEYWQGVGDFLAFLQKRYPRLLPRRKHRIR